MRDLKVWLRVGDRDDYSSFDRPDEAAYELSAWLDCGAVTEITRYVGQALTGVEAHGTPYVGDNGVSLYWGDNDAQFHAPLSDMELGAFCNTVEAELGERI